MFHPKDMKTLLFKILFWIGGTGWYSKWLFLDECSRAMAKHFMWLLSITNYIFSTNFSHFLTQFRFSWVWTKCRLMFIVTREQMRLFSPSSIGISILFHSSIIRIFYFFFVEFLVVRLNRDEFDRLQIHLGKLCSHKLLKSNGSKIRAIIALKLVYMYKIYATTCG